MTESDKDAIDARRAFVLEIARATALGMRDAMAKNNIRQTADFVNSLIFAGLLLEKNALPEGGEADLMSVYTECVDDFRVSIEATGAEADLEAMRAHRIGVTDQSPADMLVTGGLSAESVISQVAADHDLTKREQIELAVFSIVMAVVAGTQDDKRDLAMAGLGGIIAEKVEAWRAFIPSDEEMFGDWPQDDE